MNDPAHGAMLDARPNAPHERAPTPFDPLGPLETGVTLLEASAGTGKTYSITSLFVRLVIEHDIKVDRILAVTFTQAATAELTSRIRKRLGEAHRVLHEAVHGPVDTGDDEVLRWLAGRARDVDAEAWAERARDAVVGFDRANITTIHGFCQRMLSQHALEAQVPFGVQLIEDQAQLVQEIEPRHLGHAHVAQEAVVFPRLQLGERRGGVGHGRHLEAFA